ncbi:hypothetical protein D3C85_837020 [compost metagenome]
MTPEAATMALRAALQGTTPERLAAQQHNRQRAREYARQPRVTVTVNARPADGLGHSVTLSATTATLSTLEADLAALKLARERGLRAPVIIARSFEA